MKIRILSKDEIKKIYQEYGRKIERTTFHLEQNFVIKRYKNYFFKLKKTIKNTKVYDKRLRKLKNFIIKLDVIYISPYIEGGTVFKDGIILSHDLLYKNFSFALIHEAFHFLFHTKKRVNRRRMEIEANSAALILLKIPSYFWKFRVYSKLYSYKIFNKDVKLLDNRKLKPEVISVDDYIFILKNGRIEKEKEYIRHSKILNRKIEKIKKSRIYNKFRKENFPIKIVFWPEKKFYIFDAFYIPMYL